MPPESRKLLLDMLNSANLIRDFIADKSFNDFAQDQMRRAAVYYHFLIVGEALSQLCDRDETVAARISEFPRIIAFRN